MNRFSETIARLAALRSMAGQTGPSPQHDRLADLEVTGSNPGNLRARIYVPRGLSNNAALVVVLHGCTQTAAGYDYGSGWSSLAESEGFAVLYCEQQRSNNPSLCFNWFAPGDIRRDGGEAMSIHQMIDTMVDIHRLDRQRIFVTGLSAGGAMANVMLATYPEVFAGGAIIAGLPYGCAATIPEALERMRGSGIPPEAALQARVSGASGHKGPWPRLSLWHGSADQTVALSNMQAIVGQWRQVLGVSAAPTRVEKVDGQRHQVWCGADGQVQIEAYEIAGMGHGTPLALSGPDSVGAAGAFMLDVGISSTHHIARFFGLVSTADARQHTTAKPNASPGGYVHVGEIIPPGQQAKTARPDHAEKPEPDTAAPHGIAAVGKVIEDALRAAGLMK
ncbi:MAG: alpha/beta hydrolase family esterase [Allorhizobium sp.]